MWTGGGSMWTCPPTTSPAGTASCSPRATRPGRIRPRSPPPSSKSYSYPDQQSKNTVPPSRQAVCGLPAFASELPNTYRPCRPHEGRCGPLAANSESQHHQAATTPYSAPCGPRCGPAASDWICSYRINCMIGKIVKKGGFDHRQAKQQPADQNGTYPGFPRQNDPSGVCVPGKRTLLAGR